MAKKESLFPILSRSPWWMSMLIAVGLFASVRLFLPDLTAFFAGLPFLLISGYAGVRQLRTPSEAGVASRIAVLQGLSWDDFSAVLEEAFRHDGYDVTAIKDGSADYELRKAGRLTIASCKRWKAAHTGVGPINALLDAALARDAHDCMVVTTGDFSANARALAAEKSIRLLTDTALARLVADSPRFKRLSVTANAAR